MGLDPASGLYRAKLPSELNPSGPILQLDAASRLWQPRERFMGATFQGAQRANVFRYLEVEAELDRLLDKIETAGLESQRLRTKWLGVKDTEGERFVLVEREVQHRRELQAFEEATDFCNANKSAIVDLKTTEGYRQRIIALLKGKILAYEQLIESGLSRQALEGSLFDLPDHNRPRAVAFLSKMLGYMKKRQQIDDQLVKKWHVPRPDSNEGILSPIETHRIAAMWVFAKSVLLDHPQPASQAPKASYLATQFAQATTVYGVLEHIPDVARTPVLNELTKQCAAIRDWYERLELPPGPEHVISRDEISTEIREFEHTLGRRLTRYYHEQAVGLTRPGHEQPIDFDFIPEQRRSGPAPKPWRLFRAKKHGIYKIRIGESRRTAQGEEVLDVHNPLHPEQVLQTYEHRDGEWRPWLPPREKGLSALLAEADQHLNKTDSHVDAALRQERKNNNPDNIVEMLQSKAKTLDDIAVALQRHEPAAAETGELLRQLRLDSKRLRDEGEQIRIRIYKDKDFLSADRLIYLIDKGHIRVLKSGDRLKRGKGKDREYLDIYSINDAQTGSPLWHAHFHYAAPDTPSLNFNVRGAHLKTLEQSAKGIVSQRKEEMAHRKHVAIWREYIDGRTAQRIFDLAATSTDRVG
ncbi:hypothetical protein HU727_012510 [Pseudomonas sp. SWRI153]|uniref:Uncharacterized protein n=1 Tax=Pseudomonas khorasanensis TaxID=2745508 RepID=A0A923F308_9PSED|nr:hypothetical protein [Pseudomonas khorasanensis]MBV4486415.1 hypothetical protein [Pseudomonas khorasanensis]